jgi:hypothetical protein
VSEWVVEEESLMVVVHWMLSFDCLLDGLTLINWTNQESQKAEIVFGMKEVY